MKTLYTVFVIFCLICDLENEQSLFLSLVRPASEKNRREKLIGAPLAPSFRAAPISFRSRDGLSWERRAARSLYVTTQNLLETVVMPSVLRIYPHPFAILSKGDAGVHFRGLTLKVMAPNPIKTLFSWLITGLNKHT